MKNYTKGAIIYHISTRDHIRNELGRAVSPLTDLRLSDCPRDSLRVRDRANGTDDPVGEGGS